MAPLDTAARPVLSPVRSFVPPAPTDAGPEAAAALREDGVICLRSAFGASWLAVIEQGIGEFMDRDAAKESAANVVVQRDGDEGSFRYATMMCKSLDPFRRIISQSHAPDLFGSLLGTRTLHFYYDFLLIKQARCRSAVTPWYQDHSYYCMSGTKLINCWIALDSIPAETALRFVRGSHQAGDVYRAVHFDPAKEYPGTLRERPLPPDFDHDPGVEILSTLLEPGDALVWFSRTFHSAPGNHLDRRRVALSLNFVGDDVTYFDMPQEPDPPYRGEDLVDGGPITCATLPLLRTW